MSRKHFSALLVAAILLAVAVVLLVPEQTTRDMSLGGDLLLRDMDQRINDVTEVRIVSAGNEVTTTLVRGDSQWQINELSGFPANWEAIRDLLSGLAQAKIVEYKTDNPEYYGRLGVEGLEDPSAYGVRVELVLDGETTGVILGKAASSREGQYARLAGAQASVLTDRVIEASGEPLDWARREVGDIGAYLVAEVEILHPDGEQVRARKISANDADFVLDSLPAGREVKSSWAVNSLAGALAGLRFENVAPDDGSEHEDAVRFRLLTFAGIEYAGATWSRDGKHWLRVGAALPSSAAGESEDETARKAARDNEVEVAEFNARHAGWAYAISDSHHATLSKRMAELLKTEQQGGES